MSRHIEIYEKNRNLEELYIKCDENILDILLLTEKFPFLKRLDITSSQGEIIINETQINLHYIDNLNEKHINIIKRYKSKCLHVIACNIKNEIIVELIKCCGINTLSFDDIQTFLSFKRN